MSVGLDNFSSTELPVHDKRVEENGTHATTGAGISICDNLDAR